jgi:hypothetical protein
MARPSPAVNETAHVADSQRSFGLAFKNKRSRTIAKGDGLARVSLVYAGELSCEVPLTLTRRIAVRSFERLARNYEPPSKRISSCLRSSRRKSNDSANQTARR